MIRTDTLNTIRAQSPCALCARKSSTSAAARAVGVEENPTLLKPCKQWCCNHSYLDYHYESIQTVIASRTVSASHRWFARRSGPS